MGEELAGDAAADPASDRARRRAAAGGTSAQRAALERPHGRRHRGLAPRRRGARHRARGRARRGRAGRHVQPRQHAPQRRLHPHHRRRAQRRLHPRARAAHEGRRRRAAAATPTGSSRSSARCCSWRRSSRCSLAPWIVRLYAPNYSPEQAELATAFARFCLPQIFFYGVYTMLSQALNARGRFGAPMFAPLLNNMIAIATFALFIAVAGGGPDQRHDPAALAGRPARHRHDARRRRAGAGAGPGPRPRRLRTGDRASAGAAPGCRSPAGSRSGRSRSCW